MFVNLAGVGEGASDRVKALEEGSRVAGCSYTPRQGTSRSRGITGYVKKKKNQPVLQLWSGLPTVSPLGLVAAAWHDYSGIQLL